MIESYSACLGVDTLPDIPPGQTRAYYLSESVNRSMYKLLNDTRHPFTEIQLKFQTQEEEDYFREAAISGMKFYQGEGRLFSSYIIITVGERVMAGFIKPFFVEFFTIYNKLDPQWTHHYFCQALNILTINNDYDPGWYWTGDIQKPIKNIHESKFVVKNGRSTPMKVSNVACYAHGRIFYNTPNSIVYASDYIYSQGLSLEQREAVLCNSESNYPSSGDGFGAPSEMGNVSGIIVVPQSDTLNGHGDVIVLCVNGAFSIAPNRKVRSEWTNDPEMQKHVLSGKGCSAHNSIIPFANQIFYRDNNSQISSLILDIANYQNRQDLVSVSSQVNLYTDYDKDSPGIQFSTSVVSNNRMLTSIAHYKEMSKIAGIHRYASGFVSLVLQKRDQGSALSWEGLWTGPRMVGAITAYVGRFKRMIIASYDTDGKNRLYYMDETLFTGQDYRLGKYQNIESKFAYRGVFFEDEPNTPITSKKIEKVEGLLIDSNTKDIQVTYTSNSYKTEYDINTQLTEFVGCGLSTGRVVTDDVCAAKSSKNTETTSSSKSGYYFKVTFYSSGKTKFAKVAISGSSQANDSGFDPLGKCDKVDTKGFFAPCFKEECNPRVNNFNYTF